MDKKSNRSYTLEQYEDVATAVANVSAEVFGMDEDSCLHAASDVLEALGFKFEKQHLEIKRRVAIVAN